MQSPRISDSFHRVEEKRDGVAQQFQHKDNVPRVCLNSQIDLLHIVINSNSNSNKIIGTCGQESTANAIFGMRDYQK